MIPTTRQEAIAAGVDKYFTGKSCPKGHVSLRRVSGACCECAKLLKQNYAKENPEKVRAWKSANQKKNRSKANERALRWYRNNRDQAKAATALWAKNNSGKSAAKSVRYRASKMRQMPQWADLGKINRAYELAQEYRANGINAEVDHIVPLQGKTVCGLHVHYNLQIIDMAVNRSKSNRV